MTPAERRKKKANGRAGGGSGEGQITITALPAGEALVKQRRFKLAVALKVADRGEGDGFTAGDTTGGERVGDATADGEAGGVAGEEKKEAGGRVVFDMASQQALVKTFRMRSSRSVNWL